MKKHILLCAMLMAPTAFAAQPGQCGEGFAKWDLNCDGKVNYEEGMASSQAYRDASNAVNQPVAREGLPPPSEAGYPPHVINSDSGTWERSKYSPGVSAMLLRGNPSGASCSPIGVFGAHQYEDCHHVGNGDYDCEMVYDYYECK